MKAITPSTLLVRRRDKSEQIGSIYVPVNSGNNMKDNNPVVDVVAVNQSIRPALPPTSNRDEHRRRSRRPFNNMSTYCSSPVKEGDAALIRPASIGRNDGEVEPKFHLGDAIYAITALDVYAYNRDGSFEMTPQYVVIEPHKTEEKLKSGIYLPFGGKEKPGMGVVRKAGDYRAHVGDGFPEMDVGSKVIFNPIHKVSFETVKLNGDRPYYIASVDDIIAVEKNGQWECANNYVIGTVRYEDGWSKSGEIEIVKLRRTEESLLDHRMTVISIGAGSKRFPPVSKSGIKVGDVACFPGPSSLIHIEDDMYAIRVGKLMFVVE